MPSNTNDKEATPDKDIKEAKKKAATKKKSPPKKITRTGESDPVEMKTSLPATPVVSSINEIKTVVMVPNTVEDLPQQPVITISAPTNDIVKPKETVASKSNTSDITNYEFIWNAIKDRDMGLFGLRGQLVSKYCEPLPIDPNKLYLKYKVSTVVVGLEQVAPEFDLELVQNYIVLSKK